MTTLASVAVAVTWLLLAGGAWVVYQLLRQNGRLLNRLDALEQAFDALRAEGRASSFGDRSLKGSRINRVGLTPGTPAPVFSLPTVDGRLLTLDEYAGRQLVLVFSDPACGPCNALAPALERFSREMPDVALVMISRGDRESNARKVAEHGFTFPVAMQRQWEVSRAYGKFVTPMAYLIDERGVIATHAAVGVEPVMELLEKATPAPHQLTEPDLSVRH
jgi:peroxiredoxin